MLFKNIYIYKYLTTISYCTIIIMFDLKIIRLTGIKETDLKCKCQI